MTNPSNLRSHLTIPQIRAFLRCPRRHRFQHIDKIKPPFRWASSCFARAWRRALQEHFLQSIPEDPLSLDYLHGFFMTELEKELHEHGPVRFCRGEDMRTFADLAKRMLKVAILKIPLPHSVLGVNVPFSIQLADPKEENLSLTLAGNIDVIGGEEGDCQMIWIRIRREYSQVAFDLGAVAFKLGAIALGFEPAGILQVTTTKRDDPRVEMTRLLPSKSHEKELGQTVSSVLSAIHAGIDHPVRGRQCLQCSYEEVCS